MWSMLATLRTATVGLMLPTRTAMLQLPAMARCSTIAGSATTTSIAERREQIIAPPLDTRKYRWVQLGNGLEALLIHDAEASKAAAALEVRAGHFSDPAAVPGLAHFTEHMMFLGTEYEPDEGAFKAFLTRHGGSSNAFTGMEATGFHFSVGPLVLPDAMERFAAFFTCPLLREDSCEREMKAVDSEFRRNLQSDVRRLFQLTKSTSSPGHPFHKFSTGNLQTLSGASTFMPPHLAVRSFYEQHYLASQMHLCVLGRESLDQLEEIVSKCFAGLRTESDQGRIAPPLPALIAPDMIPLNAEGAPPAAVSAATADLRPSEPALAEANQVLAQAGSLLRAQPVRELRMLRLTWELPPERDFLDTKTLRLLTSLCAHEGDGSLTWLLTQRLDPPLATSVSCSSLYSLSDVTIWGFSITLTPDGLARYDEVAAHVFGFLRKLREAPQQAAPPDEGAAAGAVTLPPHLLRERVMMSKLAFEFAEQSEPLPLVKALAGRMHLHEPEKILSTPYEWPSDVDSSALATVLGRLTPDRAAALLVDPTDLEPNRRQLETWYQTPYSLSPLPQQTLQKWAEAVPHPEVVPFPPPNPYVPDDVSMLVQPQAAPGTEVAEAAEMAEMAEAASDAPADLPTSKPVVEPRVPSQLTSAAEETELGVRVWHLDAGKFDRPRASIIALLRTPEVSNGGAAKAVLTQIGAELLSDSLETVLAPTALAGLAWSVSAHSGGLLVQSSGYSQRLPKLALDLVEALTAFKGKQARFDVTREVLERGLRNRRQERPLWHAQSAVTRALGLPSNHYEDALRFVQSDSCTVEAVEAHMRGMASSQFLELLVHGNLLPSDAMRLGHEMRNLLGGTPLPADCAPLPGFRLLPPRPNAESPYDGAEGELATEAAIRHQDPNRKTSSGGVLDDDDAALRLFGVASNADESNSAIEVFFQFGEPDTLEEARLLLLAQVASKAAFHRLRTELQLGYVVQCGVRSVNSCRGLSVLIQSAVAEPASLEASIEDWLLRFRAETLEALTDAQFGEYQESVARNLEEPPKTLYQEASSIWPEIVEGSYRWRHALDLAAAVRRLSAAEIVRTFDERVAVGGSLRRKVASHYSSQADDAKAKQGECEDTLR